MIRNVSITVPPRTEVGIYGAPSSGKSSLILAMLNLAPYRGSILIDGVEARSIPRKYFQSKVTVMPQNPVIFPGTIRENLIPEEIMMDHINESLYLIVIHFILDSVELLHVVELHGDFSTPLADLNLTPGQLQRFSLAQALLHHFITQSKIILIDSATSNVDRETRLCMHDIMRQIFSNCCVITTALHPAIVAHAHQIGRIQGGRLNVRPGRQATKQSS